MSIAWKLLGGLVLSIGVALGGYHYGYSVAQTAGQAKLWALQKADAQGLATANAKALADEQAQAQHFASLQQTLEQDRANDKAQYDANVAALKSGALKLRPEWTSCTPVLAASVAAAAASGPSNDAAALLRDQDAAALVRIAADADAQVRYLQDVISSDRQQFGTVSVH